MPLNLPSNSSSVMTNPFLKHHTDLFFNLAATTKKSKLQGRFFLLPTHWRKENKCEVIKVILRLSSEMRNRRMRPSWWSDYRNWIENGGEQSNTLPFFFFKFFLCVWYFVLKSVLDIVMKLYSTSEWKALSTEKFQNTFSILWIKDINQ